MAGVDEAVSSRALRSMHQASSLMTSCIWGVVAWPPMFSCAVVMQRERRKQLGASSLAVIKLVTALPVGTGALRVTVIEVLIHMRRPTTVVLKGTAMLKFSAELELERL